MVARNSKVEKWIRWIDGSIKTEVLWMHSLRDTYRAVAEITQQHGKLPPSKFFNHFSEMYVAAQASAVRRQAEVSPRVVFLGSLLAEIRDDPSLLTRERFVSLFDRDDTWHAENVFTEEWAGDVEAHVDPAIVARDLETLRTQAQATKEFVDRHVAHADKSPLTELPTFAALNDGVDAIGVAFKRYTSLLMAVGWATLVPVPQYDWIAPFREPWILPSAESPSERPRAQDG
jgi:hypothetical protein